MAGYSGTKLGRKLGLKEGMRVLFINMPASVSAELTTDLSTTTAAQLDDTNLDYIHLFTKEFSVLDAQFGLLMQQLRPNGMLWISWPKKASKVPTDLNGNTVRELGLRKGLVDVKVCAVDQIWSGLKFVWRVKDRPK
ncbi:MAG TPA: DUF3052 family protein [Anaerolineae bacterium]|nr:DUF3052 family protein [Anaerolineae bacterium]